MPSAAPASPPDDSVDILLTAAEAFPAFERAVLEAQREIVGGFRIFDFTTRLRSPEARAVGEDWFDLLLHAVRRGVSLRLVLSDFDPVVGTDLHGLTWHSLRVAAALSELAGPDADVRVTASLHPATVGMVAQLALWPKVSGLIRGHLDKASRRGDSALVRFLADHPHLAALTVKAGGRRKPRFWPLPKLWPVTHHQKAAVIDGSVVYLGGLDLNDRRWDTPDHDRPAAETWHDAQLLVRDEGIGAALRTHLNEFTDVITGDAEPSPLAGRILRTVSGRRDGMPALLAPKPILHEIETALLDAIRDARRLIYIETQFLRDRRLAAELAKAGRRNPELQLIVILPAAPEDVAFSGATRSDARFGEFLQASCIRKLRRAYRGRVFIGSPARPVTSQTGGRAVLHGAPIIYVHAKVFAADDTFGLVGSANLNGRSLRWDTELALPLTDPATVRRLRLRCMAHMQRVDADGDDPLLQMDGAVAAWQRRAVADARRHPEAREGFVLPHLTSPARRFGKDLPTVPDEMV